MWTMTSSESTASRPSSPSSGGKTVSDRRICGGGASCAHCFYSFQVSQRSLPTRPHRHLHLPALPDLRPQLQLWWWRWGWQRHGCWAERRRLSRYWNPVSGYRCWSKTPPVYVKLLKAQLIGALKSHDTAHSFTPKLSVWTLIGDAISSFPFQAATMSTVMMTTWVGRFEGRRRSV